MLTPDKHKPPGSIYTVNPTIGSKRQVSAGITQTPQKTDSSGGCPGLSSSCLCPLTFICPSSENFRN